MRLVFMGTPAFAVPALRAAMAAQDVICVYTQPPRRAGRGQHLRKSPIHDCADANGIAVRTPATLKDPETQRDFLALDADAALVVAYGLLLPEAIVQGPPLGCLNIHASLLPRWRGAAPIQRALLAGDSVSGISLMRIEAALDAGPLLLTRPLPIGADATAGSLGAALAMLGAEALPAALAALAAGQLPAQPQALSGITYAHKITPEETRLHWEAPVAVAERTIRAFAPRPGAWFEHDGERIKVLCAQALNGAATGARPGIILDDAPTIACRDGALRLLQLQRAGSRLLDAADFQRGRPLHAGVVLTS